MRFIVGTIKLLAGVVIALLVAVLALGVLLAVRAYFWGGPIHSANRIVAVSAAKAGTGIGAGTGAGTEWTIEHESSAEGEAGGETAIREQWTARDADSDGTWESFSTPGGPFRRPAGSGPRRWLVVCLDGVPLPVLQSLWDEGYFREFFRPTATVSTMPSDTETALTAALHAAPVPGYEHSYFDRARNAIRGGGWVTLSGYGIPYIRKLDYDPQGWAKGAPYLAPEKTFNAELRKVRAAIEGSRAPVFLAHIASSDALMHVRTAQQARPLLIEFDEMLRDIYLKNRGDLGIIVFSDHGNTQTLTHGVPLEAFLEQRGWRITDRLGSLRDVAIPSYGLVGFAAVYCNPESVEQLAEDLRGLPGADIVLSRSEGSNSATVRAAGSQAVATLEWLPDGSRYRYTAQGGDPLELGPVFDELRAAGQLDPQGFAAAADLFAATALAHYPDAAARIRGWAVGGVRNRSNILVSLGPGYSHGNGTFARLVTLVSTHGGLERSATLGFAMATFREPAAIRVGDVIPANLLERATRSGEQRDAKQDAQ